MIYEEQILNDKEKRVLLQNKLINQYHLPLLSIKANYPGLYKNNLMTTYLVIKAFLELRELIKIEYYQIISTSEGLVILTIVNQEVNNLKKEMINYENSKDVNRLLDLDVIDTKLNLISRKKIGYSARKCFICDEDAKICNRMQRHSYQELQQYFNNLVINDIFDKELIFKNLTIYALSNELNKPIAYGTVSFKDSGAHQDMDYYTFIDSIDIISKEFINFNKQELSFNNLRKYGLKLEQAMFNNTNNINTHKGAIFSLILIYCGMLLSNNYYQISDKIKEFSKPIINDFIDHRNITNNSYEYYLLNIKGIRGLALNGYQSIFKIVDDINLNDLNKIMISIMNNIEDTNIINRGGIDKYNYLKLMLKNAKNKEDYDKINEYCLANNISCGGSADIYGIALILNIIKENYQFKENRNE
ncbi:MAG: citrate lyase holo-[acyl-carrier protein] synthase [Bacilli bacterium]|jgi:holo-ACP synthase/triphosphoribosyl-dephospho-CoA synthase|nr:citrate lyase holo-[acyl-carrier protein] synthase [Bacilli bacterium]